MLKNLLKTPYLGNFIKISFGTGFILHQFSGKSVAERKINNSPPCDEAYPVLWFLVGPQIFFTIFPVSGYMTGSLVNYIRYSLFSKHQVEYQKLTDAYYEKRAKYFEKIGDRRVPSTGNPQITFF